MKALVGYTGFVGSNLCENGGFGALYNSKNIESGYGTCPDILYYRGVPRQKFIADKFPEKDMRIIENAFENIKKINPKNVVLISTVDVYGETAGKDEDSVPRPLSAYGADRLRLENNVRARYPNALVVRLPGLYGKNLKKNFIYDYINFVPALLTDAKITQLAEKRADIKNFYADRGDGFWAVKDGADREKLTVILKEVGFSALNFTDSRGVFQYYNLRLLGGHIEKALENGIKVLNIATEPVSIEDIYRKLTGQTFVNHISANPPRYDFRTKYDRIFGGKDGYILTADYVLDDIKKFVEGAK